MNILYFISVHGHGRGGHFHSLNHISNKIGEKHEVGIISFGPGKSNIIKSNPYFIQHVYFNGVNYLSLRKIIHRVSQNFNPEIYHCFDEGSYNIIRLLFPSNKNIIVLNKCGGPNPTKFPYVKNIVLFSMENQKWFQNQKKFKGSNIHLIPNRVKPIQIKPKFQPVDKNDAEFNFLRICRIGNTYEKSIQDSINLISELISRNIINVKLYIIGVVQDHRVLNWLNNNELVKRGYIILITEKSYTREASQMLYLADAVIGTGRGLMEATSLKKPVLAIDKNGRVPILLYSANFKDAFKTNFSERNTFTNSLENDNLKNVIKLIKDKNYYNELSRFSSEVFEKYFNLNKVIDYYIKAYGHSEKDKRKLYNDIPHIVYSFFSFFKSDLKK